MHTHVHHPYHCATVQSPARTLKSGFAFVYMKNKRDAEDSIRKLDGLEFGYKRRRLKVQWAKQAESERKRECKPSTTLFIVNFDTARTRERDIERYFDYYGSIKRVEIKKNYAFVQFDSIDDAIKALEATNGRKLSGRTITVEYTQNEDPFAARDKDRGGRGRSISRSPPRRSRSPSYDRGRRARSRSPERRRSPDRGGRARPASRSRSPDRGGRARPASRSRSPGRGGRARPASRSRSPRSPHSR